MRQSLRVTRDGGQDPTSLSRLASSERDGERVPQGGLAVVACELGWEEPAIETTPDLLDVTLLYVLKGAKNECGCQRRSELNETAHYAHACNATKWAWPPTDAECGVALRFTAGGEQPEG